MNHRIAIAVLVLSRAERVNDSRIDDGALAQVKTFFLQITVDDGKHRRDQLMLLQQVPEVHDRGVFRDRRAHPQMRELAHVRDFIQRLLHARIVQGEPVLHQVNAQHGCQRLGFSTTAGLRVIRFDQL